MKSLPLIAASLFCGIVAAHAANPPATAGECLKNPVKADPALKSIGPISFGPGGLLLIAEPGAASVIAVDTGDTAPATKLQAPIEDVGGLLAAALKATGDKIQIVAMAANPDSGRVYFSIRDTAGSTSAVVTIDGTGTARKLDLAALASVRVTLPKSEAGPIRNISDVAFAGDRVLVTGQSNEEFSSKIFSLPLPLAADASGKIFSAETYHVAHKRWETKAPIQSFVPYNDRGQLSVVGAFTCTPIAKFSVADIESGAKIKGTSVVELGSGNRPMDIFIYKKDGKSWIVTNTNRFHQPLFGPSKYWGVRVNASYLDRADPEQINEKAARRDVKEKAGPDGIEILDSLSGAVHIAKLDDTMMVVLRETGDKFKLEAVALP